MKHGVIVLALMCLGTVASFATDGSIPASDGMPTADQVELTAAELEALEGGDLLLAVDRDKQMMVVTRINPGNYSSIECYTVKVTTSVVRDKDLGVGNPKGNMENTNRTVTLGGQQVLPTQFPSGTAKVVSTPTTRPQVTGPVIQTTARQPVSVVDSSRTKTGASLPDSGYNIHYIDPFLGSNTLGCIGVQSLAGMIQLTNTLLADNKSYTAGQTPNQTVTVSAYTNNTPPPDSVFKATEAGPKPAVPGAAPAKSTPAPSTPSAPKPAPAAPAAPQAPPPAPVAAPVPLPPAPVAVPVPAPVVPSKTAVTAKPLKEL